jgi:ABC-type spermidine/putrescine transport system permease subunit II
MNLRRHSFAVVAGLAVLLFLWIPLISVAINSFNRNVIMTGWTGFTTHWYHQAFHNQPVRAGVVTTIIIGAISTAASLVLSVTAGLWWRHASGRARRLFDALVYARIILPEVVFATALFFFFNLIHLRLGIAAIIIGHTVWNSAYATLIIQARIMGLDPALEEAAADLGATPWRAFRRVTAVLLLPGVVTAGLLALTFSFDDVVTSFFMAGAATAPLPIVLFGLIRFQITPQINAVGVLFMLFTVAMMSLAVTTFRAGESVVRRGGADRLIGMYRR